MRPPGYEPKAHRLGFALRGRDRLQPRSGVRAFPRRGGTAPIADDGSVACPGDLYGQTRRCLEITRAAVQAAGFSMGDVVRTRLLLTDVSRWREAARAHGEAFGRIRPALTLVQVSGFIDPTWLVEIEAGAWKVA